MDKVNKKELGNTLTEDNKLEIEQLILEIRDLAFIKGFINGKLDDMDMYDNMLNRTINERLEKFRIIVGGF